MVRWNYILPQRAALLLGNRSVSLSHIPLPEFDNRWTNSLHGTTRSSDREGKRSVSQANAERQWVFVYARPPSLTESAVISAPSRERERRGEGVRGRERGAITPAVLSAVFSEWSTIWIGLGKHWIVYKKKTVKRGISLLSCVWSHELCKSRRLSSEAAWTKLKVCCATEPQRDHGTHTHKHTQSQAPLH